MEEISYLLENASKLDGETVDIRGWVTGYRESSGIKFININDGSSFNSIQVVSRNEDVRVLMGSALYVRGVLLYTPDRQQKCEISADICKVLAPATSDFLIQKNEISLEVLRDNLEIRHRTQLLRAVMSVRSRLALAIHEFFDKKKFKYIHTPILTSNDGEGAGETFKVTSTSSSNFFGKNAEVFLTVTGQLHAESFAQGFGRVYTFGPTFRAELSHTQRHAAEFWMIEPEAAFYQLSDIVELADELLKFVILRVLETCLEEMMFLDKRTPGLIKRLRDYTTAKLQVITYKNAIGILQRYRDRFSNNDIEFGLDLATEHERFLVEEYANNSPLAVINFPKKIKAFYMHQNEDGDTVASFDLLVPGVGELIGGSQREADINKLIERVREEHLNESALDWYIKLRQNGYYSSSGFGLGFERLVMYVTGLDNIRDVVPYFRTPGNIRM